MKVKKRLIFALPVVFLTLSIFVLYQTKIRFDDRVASRVTDFTGEIKPDENVGIWQGKQVEVPLIALKSLESPVLGASSEERWIDVDLSEQKMRAYEGSTLFTESLVSSGLPWWPTPTGEFRIWAKLRATRMEGGEGKYYYNLPNVPYVMFFQNNNVPGWRGYGLHGAYWHNDFGRVHSHGCVNLPIPTAEKLYYWVTPQLAEGKSMVYASDENPGTRIVIHD